MKNILKILLIINCVLIIAGCTSDGECRQTVKVSLGVDFYCMELYNDTFEPRTLTDTVTVFGLNNDSLLANEKLASNIRLPLKPFATQTTYIFERKNLLPDTINFIYENENNFISLECGCLVFHKIIDIEHTYYNIDSVAVTNDFIADDHTKNIKIYFKKR